ncbi:MAG: hypothetical protein RMN52_02100 [Anaerolineae bacterium]|nr:hypothetical protein [Candidatus Roseilinea sp.]MDW8448773.1 hypothetical protein [Anaerolineae bacterium]
MPEPQPYIVGRQAEVERFAALLGGRTKYWLLNIYGPGGIGKTVVGQRMQTYAQENGIPLAFVDGIRPDLTPDRILYTIKEGLAASEALADAFHDFEREFQEYLIVQQVLQRGGGVQAMFDVVGSIKDPAGFAQIIASLGQGVTETIKRNTSNRFALERYLRGVEHALTNSLSAGLSAALEKAHRPLALIIDTYEELEGLDDWVCRKLVRAVPEGMKLVILGRNALSKVNFDWNEFGEALHSMELPELPEADAKAFLVHRGLRDPTALDEVYRFTGGYPLLLVLVWHLSREVGGWDKIGALESEADRDRIASKLLDRILREERVKDVQAFLEKGVVARWFTPEVVSVVLDVSADAGRAIYQKLERHSFVERHPYGLKFHDKVRELLVARLKFNKPEYERIVKRLTDYYAEKAGIRPEDKKAKPAEAPMPKYEIHIHSAQGMTIGDAAQVTCTFAPKTEENPSDSEDHSSA